MLEFVANHVWQSTLFAVSISLLVRACRANAAGVRHALWMAASIKFLLPFALLTTAGSYFGWLTPASIAPVHSPALETVSQTFLITDASGPLRSVSPSTATVWWPLVAISIWIVGMGVVVGRWVVRWRQMSALARHARPILDGRVHETVRRLESVAGLCRPIAVAMSDGAFEPGVFGLRRPLLLWPHAIGDRLDDRQVEAIIAHEITHVRRFDNLLATVHMVVESLFWWHPLVWWIGARLVDERERACDEAVLRLGNQPEVYAEGILRTCRFCVESPLPCVAGISGADLTRRLAAILRGAGPRPLEMWKQTVIVLAAALSLAAPVVAGAIDSALSQRREVPTGLTFEVASVKRAGADERGRVFGATMQTGRLRLVNLTLGAIVRAAYGVEFPHSIPEERVSGGPEWMDTDRFTIEATAGRAVTPAEMAGMLRTLLIERFKLVARIEPRQLPVFHLTQVTAGRLGPNLRMSEVECATAARCGIGGRAGRFLLSASPMSLLAENLSELTGRPVFDRSGLAGTFDGVLEWTPAPEELLHFDGPDAKAGATPAEPGVSLYTALQDQFGLRLVSTRGPVDFLVIESASHPSEN